MFPSLSMLSISHIGGKHFSPVSRRSLCACIMLETESSVSRSPRMVTKLLHKFAILNLRLKLFDLLLEFVVVFLKGLNAQYQVQNVFVFHSLFYF